LFSPLFFFPAVEQWMSRAVHDVRSETLVSNTEGEGVIYDFVPTIGGYYRFAACPCSCSACAYRQYTQTHLHATFIP
jgi:hypothetical protein